jgi:DNA repair exonuclease SbcCD ATPase subunit
MKMVTRPRSVVMGVPQLAMFLAGLAAGVLTRWGQKQGSAAAGPLAGRIAEFEARLDAQDTIRASRVAELETRLDTVEGRIKEIPSPGQFAAATEQLLARTMGALDEKLQAQARAIETLRNSVVQTDELLKHMLTVLDSLQEGSQNSHDTADRPPASALR